jgi:hypothetical protein
MGTFFALNELQAVVGPIIAAAEAGTVSKPGPYRPKEWSGPAVTSITVPGTSTPGSNAASPATVYVFDAVFEARHVRELRRTEHPIQPNAGSAATSITDHAYLLPGKVTLSIGMSDAMASYYPSNWGSAGSKSVSAYETFVTLMQSRVLVTLTTRLESYQNMLIESIQAADTHKTLRGLRATIVFSEVFLASVTATKEKLHGIVDGTSGAVSGSPQTTDATPAGTVQTTPVPSAVTAQHNLTSSTTAPAFPAVPGAGNWSSGNLSSVGDALA